MHLHGEMALVAVPDLLDLRVTLALFVFAGAGHSDQGGVFYGGSSEQLAVRGAPGIDDLRDLGAMLVLVEQRSDARDADPISNAAVDADSQEVTIEVGLEQGLFGLKVRHTKPLPQALNAQHHCQIKRRSSHFFTTSVSGVVSDKNSQVIPSGHSPLHFIEQDLFARAPRVEVKSEIYLIHAATDGNSCASVQPIGWEC